jgi:short-subunit dehydrogenase
MRVFITGASAGLGRALALHYAKQGAALGLVARREDALRAVAAAAGVPCSVHAADVRDAAALSRAANGFIDAHGVPDVVIANAGLSIGTDISVADDSEVFRYVLDVNVGGIINTFQPFIGAMKAARAGTLVGIASVAGYRGLPGAAAYCASKAAAISCLESLRVELRDSGIRVVTLAPGYIDTAMTAGNPYSMPFMMSADDAAARMVSAIERGRSFVILPWQMACVAKLLRILPNAVYDRVFAGAPRKPRTKSQVTRP